MNTSSARIGYARVSTVDQNPDAQIAALEAAGCTMIRNEARDGATLTGRPEVGATKWVCILWTGKRTTQLSGGAKTTCSASSAMRWRRKCRLPR